MENVNRKSPAVSTKPSLRGFLQRQRANIVGVTRPKQLLYGLLPYGKGMVNIILWYVPHVYTLRSVRRKRLLSMPENVSAVYRNFEISKPFQ